MFSDASFSTSRDMSSRQGTLIFATDVKLSRNERTVVCPMAWSSKKIPRVVTSTLRAGSIALSSSLEQTRICPCGLGMAEKILGLIGPTPRRFCVNHPLLAQ